MKFVYFNFTYDLFWIIRQFTVKNSEMAVAGVKCGWFLPLIPEIDVLYMSSKLYLTAKCLSCTLFVILFVSYLHMLVCLLFVVCMFVSLSV